MAVTVDWKNDEHTILSYTLDGHWTWNELFLAAERGVALNQDVRKDVVAVLDLRNSLGMPSGGVTQLTSLAEIPRPNTRLVIVVGGGPLTASVVSIYNRIRFTSSTKVRWVANMEEADITISRFRLETPRKILA
ncbi:MAG: hypothetical protein R3E39_12690 [Anaerolineae bacterium]